MIIIRTLRKDIANYNREDDIVRNTHWTKHLTVCLLVASLDRLYKAIWLDFKVTALSVKLALDSLCLLYYKNFTNFFLLPYQEDTMEESGWKNVHGDVFRPPQYPMILSSLLGSGIQLFCMVLIVICEFIIFLFVFLFISSFYPKLSWSNVLMVILLSITLSHKCKAAEMKLCEIKCESICSTWHEQQLDVLLKEYKDLNGNMMALMFVFDAKTKVIVFGHMQAGL